MDRMGFQEPFVVAEKRGLGFDIEGVTRDIDWLANFEPIDVIEGSTTVWDAHGRRLVFQASKESVGQGMFDFGRGEPRVEVAKEDDTETVIPLLRRYIKAALEAHGRVISDLDEADLRELLNICDRNDLVADSL